MREILFRGKCVEVGIYYKRWLEGFYGVDDGKALIAHNTDFGLVGYFCDSDTIGQYTGLKDENGVKIFEGDIIKCGKYLLLVEWEDCTGYHPFNHYGCTADECEVIGNIHDNPEFLKGSEKMESNELLEKTIAIYGTNTQLDVAVEECSELIQAICKIKRYGYTDEDYYLNLAEEMADVEIVLAELKLIFGNEDDVKNWKCDKLTRLEKRLKIKTDLDTSSGAFDLMNRETRCYTMNKSRLRREQDILDRLENVKRLIEMENTIMTANGAKKYASYCMVGKDGSRIGSYSDDLLNNLRNEIQLQLLSIVALCYGDNPDVGEPYPMLEWVRGLDENAEDKFHDVWEECLRWTV